MQAKLEDPLWVVPSCWDGVDKEYYESDPCRGKWDTEGGVVLVNQAPHQFDLFQWFMGEISEIYGVHQNINHPYIEVEDTALAIVKFKNICNRSRKKT